MLNIEQISPIVKYQIANPTVLLAKTDFGVYFVFCMIPHPVNFVGVLAGLALFLFGIRRASRRFESLFGASVKSFLSRFTRNKLISFLLGVIAAVSLQSSGAIMLLLMSFASAGLVALSESVGIILGAGVGSSLVVQLFAFRIYNFASILLVIGFFIDFWSKQTGKTKLTGQAIFAVGMIFFGLKVMADNTAAITSSDVTMQIIEGMGEYPFWIGLLGLLLAVLFQGSAPVLGMLLALAFSGKFGIESALPAIIGANIGTVALPLLGSKEHKGRFISFPLTELFIRGTTAILLIIFYPYILALIEAIGGDAPRQIANAHTIFNLVAAGLFLPIRGSLITKVISSLSPTVSEERFAPMYLSPSGVETPSVALGQALRELVRMGDIVEKMYHNILEAFEKNDALLLREVISDDDKVDLLQEEITRFLTIVSQQDLNSEQSQLVVEMITVTSELEHIADVVSKNISQYTEKKIQLGYYFSEEGFREIVSFHRRVGEHLEKALDMFPLRNRQLARKIISDTKTIVQETRLLSRNHIARLQKGTKESLETSSLHLDYLADLNRINLHISYIAYAVLGRV